jgi:hypothetical protein
MLSQCNNFAAAALTPGRTRPAIRRDPDPRVPRGEAPCEHCRSGLSQPGSTTSDHHGDTRHSPAHLDRRRPEDEVGAPRRRSRFRIDQYLDDWLPPVLARLVHKVRYRLGWT